MPVFFVTALSDSSALKRKMETTFSVNDRYAVSEDKYFVSYNGTTEQLSALLGFTDGATGSGIVLLFNSYYGRATPDLWEWIALKMK